MELSPDWVVGFTDGEGCFFIGIQKHSEMSSGYQVLPEFTIVQHERDIQILYALKEHFKCGVLRRNHGDRFAYRVRELKSLKRIVEFFEKHPLKTKKNIDFRKFRRVLMMMEQDKHLTKDGLLEILHIVSEMNTGNRPALEKIIKVLRIG